MFEPTGVIELLLVVACGFVVGGLAGLLGIGGSFLLVPILHVGLGVPVQMAVGSTACQLIGPSTSALLTRKVNRDQLRLPLILTGGIFVGTWLGARILSDAGDLDDIVWNSRSIPAVELLVLGSYLVLLCSIGAKCGLRNEAAGFHEAAWPRFTFRPSIPFPNSKPVSCRFRSLPCSA